MVGKEAVCRSGQKAAEEHKDASLLEAGGGRLDSGEARLRELGYKQELRRDWGPITSFSGSLGFMAFTTGITGAISVLYIHSQGQEGVARTGAHHFGFRNLL